MRSQSSVPPLQDLVLEMSNDLEARSGLTPSDESSAMPLWVPQAVQPGRGFLMPDGRLLSPQQLAIETLADELFFGGGPGGGKTDLLLGLAFTQHQNAIIFRRQFAQLKGAEGIVERSKQIVGLRGELNESSFLWRNLPGGRKLEFAGCDKPQDWLKYKGRAHDAKLFDELPEFPEAAYRFLIGWLRTTIRGQRTRVVGGGNPPVTEEGQWVIRYWGPWLDPNHPRPAKPGELRWYVVDIHGKDREVAGPEPYLLGGDDKCPHRVLNAVRKCMECGGRFVNPRSRTFIPSSVEDNSYLLSTNYQDVLDAMPEPLRSQMRFGNFRAVTEDHEWQIIPSAWIDAAQARWRPDGGDEEPLTAVGNDPSRGGDDEFVIVKRHAEWVDMPLAYAGREAKDGLIGAQLVYKAIDGDSTVPVNIDIGGSAGSSVYDQSRVLKLRAYALDGSRKSRAKDKSGKRGFFNKRAERIWKFREALDPTSGIDLALPPDPQMRADLVAMRWESTIRGIKVEEKKDIKERLGRSPDRGEAVIYACSIEDAAGWELLTGDAGIEADDPADELRRLKKELGIHGNGSGNGSNA